MKILNKRGKWDDWAANPWIFDGAAMALDDFDSPARSYLLANDASIGLAIRRQNHNKKRFAGLRKKLGLRFIFLIAAYSVNGNKFTSKRPMFFGSQPKGKSSYPDGLMYRYR